MRCAQRPVLCNVKNAAFVKAIVLEIITLREFTFHLSLVGTSSHM